MTERQKFEVSLQMGSKIDAVDHMSKWCVPVCCVCCVSVLCWLLFVCVVLLSFIVLCLHLCCVSVCVFVSMSHFVCRRVGEVVGVDRVLNNIRVHFQDDTTDSLDVLLPVSSSRIAE